MELSTAANISRLFYRLLGIKEGDPGLVARGETAGDIANTYLTVGVRRAQRWMLRCGYAGWRTRTAALSFSGSDSADGGRYSALPANFMQAYGDGQRSALVRADGTGWGHQIPPDQAQRARGDAYYIRGDQLWLARGASPPSELYLDYHYLHPAWAPAVTVDFPLDARGLIPAEAAAAAKEESWAPGGADADLRIERALARAREDARLVARRTRQQRRMRAPRRYGTHW